MSHDKPPSYRERIQQALSLLNAADTATRQLVEELKTILSPAQRGRKVTTACKCGQPPHRDDSGRTYSMCQACLTEYNRMAQRRYRAAHKKGDTTDNA